VFDYVALTDKIIVSKLTAGHTSTMTTRISQQQLESYLWGAATLLRGTIDAGDYKQFIFPLLFFKRLCDVFDEETRIALAESAGDAEFAAFPENHRFQIPPEAHWREVRQVATNVGPALQGAMRAIETANRDKLFGIFGDAPWTNRERLSDAMLRELIEHFSSLDLSIANLPEDELGNGYEYLIKKFADDSGHTAAEFYTNRTVVHLMTELLEPQPGESIYDPTCGSGGMLLSAVAHLRRHNREWRNVRLYGQERNLMTSSIARMNCFLHGIEDFRIERGDTLGEPKLVQGDGRLMQFDVVLANPPYSIKQWDRAKFAGDPWGRNQFGTPPQGRADYAFWQHIQASLLPSPVSGGGAGGGGRCAILFPHGVLFRQEEAEMRRRMIDADVIEAVIGLGPNLFYNSPMEACVVICRAGKPKAHEGKILFINAVNEVTRERAQSFLTDAHIARIVDAYRAFRDDAGFAHVAWLDALRANGGNLSIPLYVPAHATARQTAEPRARYDAGDALQTALREWLEARRRAAEALRAILPDAPAQSILNGALNLRASNIDPDKAQLKDAWFEVLADSSLFDRAGWQRVTFGEVVQNVNETEREPQAVGIERFIGLEHLEPGSLHIREWGNVADGTTFNRRCRPGQVLFGKRRAYQRKVAVAEFDAVVSGDIYVLAPKDGRLLPELLPFICLSERFFQHAVGTSAGSLSPRTNWSSLAQFAFDLPPLDQQRRLACIFTAIDEVIETHLQFKLELDKALAVSRHTHFSNAEKKMRLKDAGSWMSGNTPSRSRGDYWGGDFPWVSPKDMKIPQLCDSEEHLTESGMRESTRIGSENLLIVIRGMILAHSFPVAITKREVAFNQDMKAFVPSEKFDVNYLYEWFKWATPEIIGRVSDSSHGTKRIVMDNLLQMEVPIFDLKEQLLFTKQMALYTTAQNQVAAFINSLLQVRYQIMNRL
jgi:type I restriction enzyme M protein